jgi:anti-anti-sigma factor
VWHRPPIVIVVTPDGPGRVIAVVTGDVDIVTAAHLEATLRAAIRDHRPRSLVIDIGGVAFLDAAGLTALVRTYTSAGPVDIRLLNARSLVIRVLTVTGLLEFLRVPA